jgi:hypothetical protein
MQKHSHSAEFIQVIQTEIVELKVKNIWKKISIKEVSENKIIISTMWVFKYKFDEDDFLIKYKARLLTRDDMQQSNQNTYAATLIARIFRTLMTLVAAFDLETRQFNAINAFAHNLIDESTYCRTSKEWLESVNQSVNERVILQFLRDLYELKQSLVLWYRHLSKELVSMNFESVLRYECLFISLNTHLLLFFFMNDLVIIYDRRHVDNMNQFQAKLFNRFEMKCLDELSWFLRINIIRDRSFRKLWLSQKSYIEKLISEFNNSLDDRTSESSLFSINFSINDSINQNSNQMIKYKKIATSQQIQTYQQRVESINFAAVITRSDVTQIVFKLSKFLINSSTFHMNSVNRILKYLDHTKKLNIRFSADLSFDNNSKNNKIFLISSDAFFADDSKIRHSSQDYAFKLFNDLIDWKTFKQRTVITSFTKTELLVISIVEKKLIW